MNGTPEQLTVCIGVSAKFSVEDLEELYSGIRSACEDYRIDLVGRRYDGVREWVGHQRIGGRECG